jgi:uncharacterized protein YheU (UPF0270 family)
VSDWWDDDRERPPPVAVPHGELSEDALRGVIESFVLREGTDYGEREASHEDKVAAVMRQLERGEARILFDPLDSSVTIVVAERDSRARGRVGKASGVGQTRASPNTPPDEDL